jgi:hypothetical protein
VFKESQVLEHSTDKVKTVCARIHVYSVNECLETVGHLGDAYSGSAPSLDDTVVESNTVSACPESFVRDEILLHIGVIIKSAWLACLCQMVFDRTVIVSRTVFIASFIPRLSKHSVEDAVTNLFKAFIVRDKVAISVDVKVGHPFTHLQRFCAQELVREDISDDLFKARDLGIDGSHGDLLSFDAEHDDRLLISDTRVYEVEYKGVRKAVDFLGGSDDVMYAVAALL